MENRQDLQRHLKNAVMLASFSFGIMSFVLPIYTQRIGGKALAAGGLFAVFSFVTAVLRPLIGRGIDRYGTKRFLASAFLFYTISMLLFSFADSLLLLYASRLIQAVGASLMWISAYSLMTDLAGEGKYGEAAGRIDGAGASGALYGAVAGFVVLSMLPFLTGWSILFKGYAVLSLAAGIIVYRHIPETKPEPRTGAGGDTAFEPENCVPGLPAGGDFRRLLCVAFVSAVSSSMLSPILMVYLQDRFTTEIGILAAAFLPAALVYAYLPARFGRLSDRFGRIGPIVLGLIGSAAVSFGMVVCRSLISLVILWVLESVGIVIASPAEESFAADLAGKNARGSAYGLYLFAVSIGSAVGPLLGGFLYDSFGHAVPFCLNGFLLLLNALFALLLFRNRPHAVP